MSSLIRSYCQIKPYQQRGIITIGHFDGVHLGHQQLIQTVIKKAQAEKAPSMVITFEPYANEFFAKPNARLTNFREKYCLLSAQGIDYVLILPFNQKLAVVSASDFIQHILYEQLHPREIIVGDDFRFGYQRQGDISLLKKMGEVLDFSVTITETLVSDQQRISSTRIREALALGQQNLAKQLLGHPYFMMGRIISGKKLGRQLGFPTINIDPHRRLSPIKGIYTVLVHGLSSYPLQGVASIGKRPTIDGTKTLLEVHLLDFNQDVYGAYVKVEFCQKLREEIHYPSISELKEQIAKDVKIAHDFFQQKR